ncbi:hypothetical protein [Corynebacterium appendicis]|uniref:hypothetical protein n=1 Tax=Corynebacterium appendicis TaxID=163202 RepID=UPI00254D61AB|nr:hypothetical protein [Corynebacterium appendicis]MDK8624957.1 hypothetical protein [Corynebacterium appendicis]
MGGETCTRRLTPPGTGSIPVFVILYGEANEGDMKELADVTGGAVFDAINDDLSDAFKESYQ